MLAALKVEKYRFEMPFLPVPNGSLLSHSRGAYCISFYVPAREEFPSINLTQRSSSMHALQAHILHLGHGLTPTTLLPPQIQRLCRQHPLQAQKSPPSHHPHNTKQKWQETLSSERQKFKKYSRLVPGGLVFLKPKQGNIN